MQNTHTVDELVDILRPAYEKLSDTVWENPETCYGETRSAAAHAEQLRAAGFRVETGVAGIPTTVVGEAGQGGPVIAFLGEFDALPKLSQTAGATTHAPVEEGGAGHGCGHNLLGAGAMLAAASLKQWLEENGVEGRVRYYGCPAEEGGGAKAFMVRAGLFKDVDIAISWHPENMSKVAYGYSLANTRVDYIFHGRSAHAAMSPHLGRSALDALELSNVGANYLREHIPTDWRLHYAIIDAGGIAPNVVQDYAKVRYSLRSPDVASMFELYARMENVVKGAAMMTGTEVEIHPISAVSNVLHNAPLAEVMWDEVEALGPLSFDENEYAFAKEMQKSFTETSIADAYKRFGVDPIPEKALCDFAIPRDGDPIKLMGSTDLGDVSWVVPLVQFYSATCAIGTPFHSWQLVAQGQSSTAKKGMARAAAIMARTGLRVLENPAIIEDAKKDLANRVGPKGYMTPIPDGTEPPIKEMAG